MKKMRRGEAPQDRSVVPSVEEREALLQKMLEEAESEAREQVRKAEEEARRRVEEAQEGAPRSVQQRRREARAALEAEVRGEFRDSQTAAREVEEQAAGKRAQAVELVVSAVWGGSDGR